MQWAKNILKHNAKGMGEKQMAMVMIGNFGVINGFQTYRVCGDKEKLQTILEACLQEGATFKGDWPQIEHIHRGQYSLLLEIKTAVEVGENGCDNASENGQAYG